MSSETTGQDEIEMSRGWPAPPRIRSLVQVARLGAAALVLLTAVAVGLSLTWGHEEEATQRKSLAAVGQRLWRHVVDDWAQRVRTAARRVDSDAVSIALGARDRAALRSLFRPMLAGGSSTITDAVVLDASGTPLVVLAGDRSGVARRRIARPRAGLIAVPAGAVAMVPLGDDEVPVGWLRLRADPGTLAEELASAVGLPLALTDAGGALVHVHGDRHLFEGLVGSGEARGPQRVMLPGGGALWIGEGPLAGPVTFATRRAIAALAAAALAAILAVIGVSWFCRRLRRLGALRDSMLRTLASQHFSDIPPVDGYDEVAELATVFNALSREMWADLEKRERMQAELQRTEELHRRILDLALDGTVLLDADGVIQWWSKPAERIFGWASEEALGRELAELLRDEDGEDDLRAWLQQVREASDGTLYSFGVRHRGGHSLLVEASGAPLTLEDGERFCVFFRDVTDRHELEMRLAQSQKLETVGQLAAGIAHEINTPTQYVTDNTLFLQTSFKDVAGFVTAVRSAVAEAPSSVGERVEAAAAEADLDYLLVEAPKAIEQSLEGLDRVARIVRSMKEFSHPTRGELEIVDVNRSVEATCTVARNEWKYVADLDLDLDPQRPMVCCLPGELNQAVLNLIVNAAHAIGDRSQDGSKGKIRVATRANGDELEIAVSDTGTGIAPEIQSRIFDPFFTTKEVGRGTGQGLAIVYDVVVKKHGGRIDLDSELGEGSTFTLRIPMGQGAPSGERLGLTPA